MTGDSENEIGPAGDAPAPLTGASDAQPGGGEEHAHHPRPFRNWASAQEGGPSVWGKLKQRISGVFKKPDAPDSDAVAEAPTSEETLEPVAADEIGLIPEEPILAEAVETPTQSADVEWIQPDAPATTPADQPDRETFASVEDALPADEPALLDTAPATETPPAEPKRGFFGRLFGRRSKPEKFVEQIPDTDEHDRDVAAAAADALDLAAASEFPPSEETPTFAGDAFGSDEAAPVAEVEPQPEAFGSATMPMDLPMLDSSVDASATVPMDVSEPGGSSTVPMDVSDIGGSTTVPIDLPMLDTSEPPPVIEEPPTPREKRPSFIGRLFGKRPKSEPRPSLEIEIHADRIEAAVAQADEPVESPPAVDVEASTQPFVLDEVVPSVDDQRFAPPIAPAGEATLSLDSLGDTLEVQQDSRPTMEVPQDSRPTMEVEQESRPTMEVSSAEMPVPEVLDEVKTDEFEIVLPPVAEAPADLGVDTKEVSKQSLIARILGRTKKTKEALGASQTVVEGNPVFLFTKFRAFYNEIIRFKHQKSEFTAGFSTAIVTDYAADLTPDAAAEAQSKHLAEMLELQSAEAKWMGGEAAERYPDAQYAMAALADELFAQMDWDGKDAWHQHLVEVRLYRSRAADVEVFKRMDKLLKDKPNSHVARDMARVYLLVLAAGFQGKYRPFELPRALAEYRQRLYEYIHSGDALMLYAPDRKIFPDAESRTLVGSAVSRFSAAQRWAAILFFLVTAYTVIAHVAWNRVSADLKDVTQRIRSGSTTAGVR